LVLMK